MKKKIEEIYSPLEFTPKGVSFQGGKQFLSWGSKRQVTLQFHGKYPEKTWTTGEEMLRELFPDEWKKYHDKRTLKYLQALKKNIGLVRISHSQDQPSPEVQYQFDGPLDLTGSGKYDVGKIGEQWAIQYSYRCAIDDFDLVTFFYDRKPTRRMLTTTQLIEEIQTFFEVHGWNPENMVFRCWECGRETHWLDTSHQSLAEKWDGYKDRYCGC